MMSRGRAIIVLLGTVAAAVVTLEAQREVSGQLVRVRTRDGITLHGAIWMPSTGKSRVGIAIAPGAGRFHGAPIGLLAERFAQAGYVALAMDRRDHGQEMGYYFFESAAMDHAYMVDLLVSRGVESVVLAGHSYGTVTAPYYVAASRDHRIAGLVLLAPLGDMRQGIAKTFGTLAEYDGLVEKARHMVAGGKGQDSFILPPRPGGHPTLSTYEVFLNRAGPDAKTVSTDALRKIGDLPVLAIKDPADPSPSVVSSSGDELKSALPKIEFVLLSDAHGGRTDPAAHNFAGREEDVARLTIEWLAKHGLRR